MIIQSLQRPVYLPRSRITFRLCLRFLWLKRRFYAFC